MRKRNTFYFANEISEFMVFEMEIFISPDDTNKNLTETKKKKPIATCSFTLD